MTQGAVSKQIKLLEEHLDCSLFLRRGPYLQLTPEGEKLRDAITAGLDIIRHGISSLQRRGRSTLTLSILPSFASHWLLPRLGSFEADHPEISLRLASSYQVVDFSLEEDIDAAIRLTRRRPDDLYSLQLTRDVMFPVCAPTLAGTINDVSDLQKQTLLMEAHPLDEWRNWFQAIGQPLTIGRKRILDDTGMQIQGAIEGRGICLAREDLVRKYLESGALVRLFSFDFQSNAHYYFVCPATRRNDATIAAFRLWLDKVRDA